MHLTYSISLLCFQGGNYACQNTIPFKFGSKLKSVKMKLKFIAVLDWFVVVVVWWWWSVLLCQTRLLEYANFTEIVYSLHLISL